MAEFPYWMQHGGHYRPVLDLSTPWVPSPIVHQPVTAPYTHVDRVVPSVSPVSENQVKVIGGQNKRRRSVPELLRTLVRGSREGTPKSEGQPQEMPPDANLQPEVQLREWKAWGYYARPKLPVSDSNPFPNLDFIRNYPPEGPISPSVDVDERFASLRQPGGRWIPGLQHPALPPRPPRWKNPDIGGPQPFPWELQLNPFLQHRVVGLAPVCWDVSIEPARAMMGYELHISQRVVPLNDADKAQPATFPFVTHMYINGIADFPLEHFPWPIMIQNDSGITCADVFEAIFRDLNFHVSEDEFNSWNSFQQRQTKTAFRARHGGERNDDVRRYDVLGSHRMFRGLEPHPNLEGWMLYVGLA